MQSLVEASTFYPSANSMHVHLPPLDGVRIVLGVIALTPCPLELVGSPAADPPEGSRVALSLRRGGGGGGGGGMPKIPLPPLLAKGGALRLLVSRPKGLWEGGGQDKTGRRGGGSE